jgi:O-antigen/teichoic acid export membrane protein
MSHRHPVSGSSDPDAAEPGAPSGSPNAAVADIPPDLVAGGDATARAVSAAIATAPAASQATPESGLDEGEEAAAEAVATAGTTPSAQHAALDRSLMRGLAWTGSVKLVHQGVAWASTLIVARLLTPRDYGLVGMGTLYMGLVTLLSEFGIGTSIVTLRHLTREQIAQINTLSVMFGIAGFLVSCLLAFPLAWFFKEPLLPPVIVALAGAFVITSFRTVPYALLQRDLRFKRLAALEGAQAILLATASVFFAWSGFHYWTLVISSLLGAAFSTGVVLYYHRHAFARPRRETLSEAITFSRSIIVGRLSFYWFSNADYLVAGKALGNAAFGAYQVAYNLSMTLLEKTSGLVLRVTPAVFSSVQNDTPALRRYWLGITEGTALVTFPITIGLSLVTRDFVTIVLGPKWYAMIGALQILSIYAGFRSILPLTSQLLVATRKGAKTDARNAFQVAIAMPLGFWIGSHWGVTGIAAAWAIVHPVFGLRLLRYGIKRVEATAGQYLQALRPALTGVAVMTVAVVASRLLMPDSWHGIARLVLEILAGAVAYCAAVLILHRDRLLAFRQLWLAMRKR